MGRLSSAVDEFVPRAQQHPIAATLALLVAVALATRLWTAHVSPWKKSPDPDAKAVPAVPYWLPVIGHIPNMALDSVRFLSTVRSLFDGGVFALTFLGSKHILISRPEVGVTLLNKPAEIADGHALSEHLLRSNFGFPAGEHMHDRKLHDLRDEYKKLLSEPGLSTMIAKVVRALRNNLPDLVTFNDNPVDQSPWERGAGAAVTTDLSGDPVVETNLWDLVRDFVSLTASPSLTGTDYTTNVPNFWKDFWEFDSAVLLLALDLPLWVPWPQLRRARAALARMHEQLREFEVALDKRAGGEDPGLAWRDLDNVSELIHSRVEVYRKHKMSMEARIANEMGLVWSMNGNANPFIAWVVAHVYADADLLRRVREEVAPFLRLAPAAVGASDPVARLESIDVDGLTERCPLLKAAYIETLRLEVHAWSIKVIRQDFVMGERDKSAPSYFIPAGAYAHVAHELHHTDPKRFVEPEKWSADRHVRWETRPGSDEKVAVADMGTVRPYGTFHHTQKAPARAERPELSLTNPLYSGGGVNMCKGRAFAAREVLIFTAAITAFYDIEPAGGGRWEMPVRGRAAGTKRAVGGLKVWIRPRDIS